MMIQIKTPLQVLEETSRTFYIPIIKLPSLAQDAVASAYLCLRAIDQIEDHETLTNAQKAEVLTGISFTLQTYSQETTKENLQFEWFGTGHLLPEVSLRLAEWIFYCPNPLRARVADCTATMADRMASWACKNWKINNEKDLDAYTFAVAGSVGLILCEIWEWSQGTKTDRSLAIGYGRGLQSVNILRNGNEDLKRGVTFYPPGWTNKEMIAYSRHNLKYAQQYMKSLPENSAAYIFSEIPLALAEATIDIIEHGLQKLTREQVLKICKISA